MKSILISDEAHRFLKTYCAKKDLKMNKFVETLITIYTKKGAEAPMNQDNK
jgi:hypothetical protein